MGKIFHKLLVMTGRIGILTGEELPYDSRT